MAGENADNFNIMMPPNPEDPKPDDKEDSKHEGVPFDYNPEFEQLLKETGDHCQVYSILHQMSCVKYKTLHDKCNIPLIIITAVIGFVTGIGLPYAYMNTALGAGSVLVSIIKSIVSYLKLSERSENHRICSLQFGQISTEIKTELSLRREQRQPAKVLLNMVKVKYKNLMEVAQLLDNDIIARFREKYLLDRGANSEISLPPVFSNIPGIKILGAENDSDYTDQLHKNLERYMAEKQFEREHVECELKHNAALRMIRDRYRVSGGGKGEDLVQGIEASRSSMRPLTRQRSLPSAALNAALNAVPSVALSVTPSQVLPSTTLTTISESQETESNLSPLHTSASLASPV
jgi:hypothetical protein